MDYYTQLSDVILQPIKHIKLLIMDVDGVLSDGKIYYTSSLEPTKSFFVRDGLGISLLHQNNIDTAIITGRDDSCVKLRAQHLDIKYYFAGYRDKTIAFNQLLSKTDLQPRECAYIGDDIIDLPVLTQVGLAVAVRDAHPDIKSHCHYITKTKGGHGAVREVCDIILYAQNKLASAMDILIR